MTINKINVGDAADDGNGDLLRDAFIKINDNTQELDTAVSQKANASDLENYATTGALTNGLGEKVNNADFALLQTTVSNKANQADVDTSLALKANQTDFEALQTSTDTSFTNLQTDINNLDTSVQNHESRINALEAGGGDGAVDVEALAGNGLQTDTGKLAVKAGGGIAVSAAGVAVKLSQSEGGSSNSGLVLNAGSLKIVTDETLEIDATNKLKLSQTVQDGIAEKIDKAYVDDALELKADKDAVNTALAGKAPVNSSTLVIGSLAFVTPLAVMPQGGNLAGGYLKLASIFPDATGVQAATNPINFGYWINIGTYCAVGGVTIVQRVS